MMAAASIGNGDYMPDSANSQFSGKNITAGSGLSSPSGHATTVGINFYGNTNSMTPAITDITVYEANDFLGKVLGFNSGNDPLTATAFDDGNHSNIGNGLTVAEAENLRERFDFVINRDNTVMAVGAKIIERQSQRRSC